MRPCLKQDKKGQGKEASRDVRHGGRDSAVLRCAAVPSSSCPEARQALTTLFSGASKD